MLLIKFEVNLLKYLNNYNIFYNCKNFYKLYNLFVDAPINFFGFLTILVLNP